MNVRLHYLETHVEYFPSYLGDYSEEHGERFHKDIKVMEKRYQGNWDERFIRIKRGRRKCKKGNKIEKESPL